jgi:hypothetical protein
MKARRSRRVEFDPVEPKRSVRPAREGERYGRSGALGLPRKHAQSSKGCQEPGSDAVRGLFLRTYSGECKLAYSD